MNAAMKITVAIILLTSVSIAIYIQSWHLVPLFVAVIFAFTVPFIGKDKNIEPNGKTRLKSLYLSFLPGLGHIYLGRTRSSVPYVLVFVASIFIFSLVIPFTNDAIYLILLFALTYFADSMIAVINTEAVCDEINLPHEDRSSEMNVKNRPRAYVLSITIPYFFLILVALYCFLMDFIHVKPIYYISISIWTLIAIYSIIWYFRQNIQRKFNR